MLSNNFFNNTYTARNIFFLIIRSPLYYVGQKKKHNGKHLVKRTNSNLHFNTKQTQ